MKLAVLSDIHGNLTAFEAVLADLATVGEVDEIWVLGDLAAFGPRPAECVRRVQKLVEEHSDKKCKVIGGNTDRYLVTGERFRRPGAKEEADFTALAAAREATDVMLNWNLRQLSWDDYQYLDKILYQETTFYAKGYGYAIGYHAVPGDDEAMLTPETSEEEALDYLLDREGKLAIGGHIHVQMDRQLPGWRVINVGSIGLSFDQPGKAEWALFTFEDGNVTVDLRAVPYDIDALTADLQATGHPVPGWVTSKVQPQS